MKGSGVRFMAEEKKKGTQHPIYFREGISARFSRIPFAGSSKVNIKISFGD